MADESNQNGTANGDVPEIELIIKVSGNAIILVKTVVYDNGRYYFLVEGALPYQLLQRKMAEWACLAIICILSNIKLLMTAVN